MMMNPRRKFLIALGVGVLAAPFVAFAQRSSTKVPHIGYLSLGSEVTNGAFLGAFREALAELGYVDGRDIVIDVRWSGDSVTDLPDLASGLASAQPAAIVTTCIPSTLAAKAATKTIPVVMSVDGDPVASGLVSSLARPGGNVTGTSTLFEALIPKWLELINAATPKARRVAIVVNPDNPIDPYFSNKFEQAAGQIGLKLVRAEAGRPEDLDRAFTGMRKQGAGGFVVMTDALLAGQVQRIVKLAERNKLPGIYGYREFAEAGGLMSYGLSFRDYYKGVARYVDKVLKGANPAELPVEQPTRVEFVVNLSTAKRLGIKLPAKLLARADRVIG
jgi:putative ABC transport system substrate-binding protein